MRSPLFFVLTLALSLPSFLSPCLGQITPTNEERFEKLLAERKYSAAMDLLDSLEKSQPKENQTLAQIHLLKAVALQSQKKNTDAAILADSLLKSGAFDNLPELQMRALLVLGNVNYSRFRQKEATTFYLQIDSLGDLYQQGVETQIKALTNLGTLMLSVEEGRTENFLRSGDFYYSKALQQASESKDSTSYYDLSTYVATQDFGKGKLDSIEAIYLKAIRFFEKENEQKLLSSTLWGLGWAYESEGDFEKAEKTYQKIISLNSVNPQNVNGLARAHWIYANFLNRKNDLEGAIREFETAQRLFLSEKELDVGPLSGTTFNLATLYRKVGRDREAYEFLEKAQVMQDSIDRAMEYDQLKELEIKYQSAQKDKAIAELEVETQKRNFLLALGSASFVILGGAFLFYFLYQRKKIALAEKVTELDEVKNRFFENITHEFRTPLTLIDSPLQFLEKDPSLSEDSYSKLSLIRRQSDRLLELVDQILSLNQLKNSTISVLLKEQSLAPFIRSLVEPFEFNAKEKGLRWSSEFDISETLYWYDEDLLRKIISNLLHNSLKYTAENGLIHFSAKETYGMLDLCISNSVSDISKGDLNQIFDRFYQSDKRNPGFGIGLALVKALVSRLKGTIQASIEEDQLRFNLAIPLTRELLPSDSIVLESEFKSEGKVNTVEEPDLATEKPILLIAEDHPDTRSILTELFQHDYHVVAASSGEEAWTICKETLPELVLSDISMPGISGLELCQKIKTHEFLSHIPVILLTASQSKESRLAGNDFEADCYLTKPFDHNLILGEVKKLVQQRRKLRERYSKEVILKPVELAINSAEEVFLEKLQSVVSSNFENPEFNADDFAAAMDMSRMQLHRKIKHLTGLSAMEFLKNQRLKTAASLLSRGDLTVSDVAYAVGFNDLSHFSKSFKATFGSTPTDFLQGN